MNPCTLQDLYKAKQIRRSRLVNLPIDQKVDLIEKLQELGRTMVRARASLEKPADKDAEAR
jgi:hypothetical protein